MKAIHVFVILKCRLYIFCVYVLIKFGLFTLAFCVAVIYMSVTADGAFVYERLRT